MSTISPLGTLSKSYLVDSSAAVQVVSTTGGQYRIRSRNNVEAWISWAAANTSGGAPTMQTTLPVVGTPQSGIIGLNAYVTETFTLPANCFFQASSGATFEVIGGEGA